MVTDKGRLEAIKRMVLEGLGEAPVRPRLRLVVADTPSPAEDDAVTRDCRLKRIRWLAKAYGLRWLVDQHCFGRSGPDCLDCDELVALHNDMERARECAADGISFEDAGLIRSAN